MLPPNEKAIDLVEELNDRIYYMEDPSRASDWYFSFSTDGYSSVIQFMDTNVFDDGSVWSDEEEQVLSNTEIVLTCIKHTLKERLDEINAAISAVEDMLAKKEIKRDERKK